MPGIRAETLLTMTYFIKAFTLDRAWLGLADDELFWEPVVGAWGVRRREECTTPNPFGSADPDWVADYDADLASAADWRTTIEPLTTIGWLFWHVGSQPGRLADLDFLGGSKTAAQRLDVSVPHAPPDFHVRRRRGGDDAQRLAPAHRSSPERYRRRSRASDRVVDLRRAASPGLGRADHRVDAERDQPPRHADLHVARPLRRWRGPHVRHRLTGDSVLDKCLKHPTEPALKGTRRPAFRRDAPRPGGSSAPNAGARDSAALCAHEGDGPWLARSARYDSSSGSD